MKDLQLPNNAEGLTWSEITQSSNGCGPDPVLSRVVPDQILWLWIRPA
jgi:hypothetical protein